jgi:eukaryotic-like serine/threonine-protein kinase
VSVDQLALNLSERYRIERELGAGGMATVYLAHDLKHDRRVAIKVLKPELAAVLGAQRFIAEIKTTAALQHPHILPLFDSGSADGLLYYVMPYIQGETIRERLNRETQFGIDDAVRIAREVADALDYAHRNNVIHRDIKPENILLHDGRAMVMDFGIALAVSAAAGGRMTETGLSLGTPHYMSPEQATAEKEITARSDVYSLASVLYEMLAGDPPFTASSAQAVIMKIVTETAPPVAARRKTVPPNVAAALSTALEKLPADRFDSAKAFGDALSNPAFATAVTSGATRAAPVARGIGRRELAAWVAVAGLTIAVIWLARGSSATPSGSAEPVKFELPLPGAAALGAGAGPEMALSLDGRTLVYQAQGPNGIRLARRAMSDTTGIVIPGTEGGSFFALSPDGKSVVYMVDSLLKKVPIEGGPPTTITTYRGQQMSWGPNDVIVIGGTVNSGGFMRVPAAGGVARQFAFPDTLHGERSMRWPRILADGKTVLYTSWPANSLLPNARIGIVSLEGGAQTILDLPGAYAFGVFDGRLVYARPDGPIMSVPIDIERRRVLGEPSVLIAGVEMGLGGASKATLSDNGTLLYQTGTNDRTLVLADRAGRTKTLATSGFQYQQPRFSPSGKQIAVSVNDIAANAGDVWVIARDGTTKSKLPATETSRWRYLPEWTADGKRLLFLASTRSPGTAGISGSLASQPADGSAAAEIMSGLDYASTSRGGYAVSRDGRTLLSTTGRSAAMAIVSRSLGNADTTSKPFLTSSASVFAPTLSPDGKWLAYVSDESGKEEVYVRAFSGPPSRWPVSLDGGAEPRWSSDGRHIYYRSEARKLIEAAATTSPTFAVSTRTVLFDDPYVKSPRHSAQYDVSADGSEFVMIRRGETESKVLGIVNFQTVLARARGR